MLTLFLSDTGTFNSSLSERFRGNKIHRNLPVSDTMHNNGYRVELNLGPREYLRTQHKIAEDNPKGWQGIPEIPTSNEIALNDNEAVSVPANKVKGRWKSTEKYLRAHYELLREDSIAPIRDAVDAVRKTPEMMDNKDLAIYEKVGDYNFCVKPKLILPGPYPRFHFLSWRRSSSYYLLHSSSRLQDQLAIELTLSVRVHTGIDTCKRQIHIKMRRGYCCSPSQGGSGL